MHKTRNEPIETFPYHEHSKTEAQESVYVPGALRWVEVHLLCPRCKSLHPPLQHAERTKCGYGLHMQRFGNALLIWEPKSAEIDVGQPLPA